MTVVSDVLSDRPSVCSRLWLTIAENGSPAWRMRFSRTRSKTTIVSWTEKPMTVSIAVTNRASISRPKSVPQDGEDADDHDDVVEQRGDGGHAHPEVGEAERHPAQDAEPSRG